MSGPGARRLAVSSVDSPLGTILVVSANGVLIALDFEEYRPRMERLLRGRFGAFELLHAPLEAPVTAALGRYFEGDFGALAALRAEPGGSAFQARVWRALRAIEPGTTVTYGALAHELGLPSAARAVGYANSLNPIAIVIPCHRVVGASGDLTGYAGGLQRKRWLLDHEHAGPVAMRLF
jgi:O-6-methylguanine DNA methyltransferase